MANASTLITRRDYGLKVAMPGFDAQTAGDNQLLFNSSFPILQIKILSELYCKGVGSQEANQGGEYIGTIGASTSRVFRWYHGLGFPPFFLLLDPNGIKFNTNYAVDENYIYRMGDFYGGDWPTQDGTKVLVCPIDLTKDIEYPYTALPFEAPKFNSLDYGFKSIEYGEMNEDDFNNLGVNIRLQSQMVLACKTLQTSTIPANPSEFTTIPIDYTLPAGMTLNDVVAYGFSRRPIDQNAAGSPTAYFSVGQSGQAVPSVFTDYPTPGMGNIELQTLYSQPGALVVTRLPFTAASVSQGTF